MARARVTLLDVAQRAGVSRTTASFVLTGRTDMRIALDTTQRVLAAARDLGYRPNLMARSLRTNITSTIGFVSDSVASQPWAGAMIRGAIRAATARSHLLVVGETEGDPDAEARLVEGLVDRGIDGFVYAAMSTRHVDLPAGLAGQPMVLLNCMTREPGPPCVLPDEYGAGRAAGEALVAAGHRDGVVVVGERPPGVHPAQERVRGTGDVLAAAGGSLLGGVDCLWDAPAAFTAVGQWLDTDPSRAQRVTAFLCLNDRAALGVYQLMADRGLAIPDDVSVVAFDDSDLASWLRPGLSSVLLPHEDLGRVAVDLLLDEPDPAAGRRVLVPMTLHARDSVAAPRR